MSAYQHPYGGFLKKGKIWVGRNETVALNHRKVEGDKCVSWKMKLKIFEN